MAKRKFHLCDPGCTECDYQDYKREGSAIPVCTANEEEYSFEGFTEEACPDWRNRPM